MNNTINGSAVRYRWLDALRGFCILTVVYIHNVFDNSTVVDTACTKWITAFHMFLFFAISGFLFKYSKMDAKYLAKKAKSLMVPFVIWGIVVSKLVEIVSDISNIKSYHPDIKSDIIKILTGRYSGMGCWFLLALMMVFIFEFLLKTLLVHKNEQINVLSPKFILAHIVLLLAGYFIPTSIGQYFSIKLSLIAGFFFYVGMVIKEIWDKYNNAKIVKHIDNIWVGIAAIIIATVLNIFNGKVTFSAAKFSFAPLTLLNAVLFIFGFILLFKNLDSYMGNAKITSVLCDFGKYSLEILCTHKIFILAFRIVEMLFKMEDHSFPSVIAFIIVAIIEYILIKFIFNRVKFVFGK